MCIRLALVLGCTTFVTSAYCPSCSSRLVYRLLAVPSFLFEVQLYLSLSRHPLYTAAVRPRLRIFLTGIEPSCACTLCVYEGTLCAAEYEKACSDLFALLALRELTLSRRHDITWQILSDISSADSTSYFCVAGL